MRHHEELRFLGRNFPDSLLAAGRRGDFTIWGKPSRSGGNLGSWKPSGDLERMAEKFPSGDGDDIVGGEEGMKGEVRDPSPVFGEENETNNDLSANMDLFSFCFLSKESYFSSSLPSGTFPSERWHSLACPPGRFAAPSITSG